VLTEAGLLPGALQKNRGLKFLCQMTELVVAAADSALTAGIAVGTRLRIPINHFEGNYTCSAETLSMLIADDRVVDLKKSNGRVVSKALRQLGRAYDIGEQDVCDL